LGGGMRQAGILAAAGIVALETMIDRLEEDHARARKLANGLKNNPALILDPGTPYTNMVFCSLSDQVPWDGEEAAARLKDKGILVGGAGQRRFRLVTHYWIDDAAVERVVEAFMTVLCEM
jgi:threonine aldolase